MATTLTNPTIEEITNIDPKIYDVRINQIIKEYIKYLTKNTTITTLKIGFSNIGDLGAGLLAKNTTITTLDIGANIIGALGAAHLAKNTTITTLYIGLNNIGVLEAGLLTNNTKISKHNYDQKTMDLLNVL